MGGERWKNAFRSMGGVSGVIGMGMIVNDLGLIGATTKLLKGDTSGAFTVLRQDFTPGRFLSALVNWWLIPQGIKGVSRGFGVRIPWWL